MFYHESAKKFILIFLLFWVCFPLSDYPVLNRTHRISSCCIWPLVWLQREGSTFSLFLLSCTVMAFIRKRDQTPGTCGNHTPKATWKYSFSGCFLLSSLYVLEKQKTSFIVNETLVNKFFFFTWGFCVSYCKNMFLIIFNKRKPKLSVGLKHYLSFIPNGNDTGRGTK